MGELPAGELNGSSCSVGSFANNRSSNTFRFRNLWLDFSDPIAQGRLGDRILLTPVLAG